MKVITAETAGFCFGVKRAVDMVYEELNKSDGAIFTYGPIIHNDDVVSDLEQKGVKAISEDEIPLLKSGDRLIIRSHGAPKRIYDAAVKAGADIVDATCPFVAKIHDIVRESERRVIIIGDGKHPEVIGIRGWAPKGSASVESIEEFKKLEIPVNEPITVVAQTTFNYAKFQEIIAQIDLLGYDKICFNTVCNATQERQKEAENIASCVDAMIVIGSRLSSNTRKLYEICKEKCKVTWFVGRAGELQLDNFDSVDSVGITAGASTPKHIIEEVQTYVRS